MDEKKLAKHWGMILLRGIVAILFGILALAATGITLDVLLMILGIYLLIDGGVTIIAGVVASHHKHIKRFVRKLCAKRDRHCSSVQSLKAGYFQEIAL